MLAENVRSQHLRVRWTHQYSVRVLARLSEAAALGGACILRLPSL